MKLLNVKLTIFISFLEESWGGGLWVFYFEMYHLYSDETL